MLPINSFQYNKDNEVHVNILLLTNQHQDSLNIYLVNLSVGFSKAYLSTKHPKHSNVYSAVHIMYQNNIINYQFCKDFLAFSI